MNKLASTAIAIAFAACAIVPKAHAASDAEGAVILDGIASHGPSSATPTGSTVPALMR
jgi:hypothetical protein